ncbi:hypothetical protein L6R52_01630, partial [Myxococcota bacterium]|nr:hypothetical protein [Myxococcota bacterium]
MSATAERRWAVAVGVMILAGLSTFARWSDELPNPNEASRIYLTMAIVEDHTLAIDRPMARFGTTLDHARRRGHRYSEKAPGMALLAVPVYAAMRALAPDGTRFGPRQVHAAMRFVATIVPSALFGALVFLWLAAFVPEPSARAALVLAGAFATPARFYGDIVFGHQTAGLAAAGALLLLSRAPRAPDATPTPGAPGAAHAERHRAWFVTALLSGLLAGLAFMVEYPAAVAALGCVVLLVVGRRARELAPFV